VREAGEGDDGVGPPRSASAPFEASLANRSPGSLAMPSPSLPPRRSSAKLSRQSREQLLEQVMLRAKKTGEPPTDEEAMSMTDDQLKTVRLAARRVRNRDSAALSRKRKNDRIAELSAEVADLKQQLLEEQNRSKRLRTELYARLQGSEFAAPQSTTPPRTFYRSGWDRTGLTKPRSSTMKKASTLPLPPPPTYTFSPYDLSPTCGGTSSEEFDDTDGVSTSSDSDDESLTSSTSSSSLSSAVSSPVPSSLSPARLAVLAESTTNPPLVFNIKGCA